MVCAFSHPDPAIATLVANAMDEAGIDSVLRNQGYGAAMGEIPPVAAWAEVWIADADRLDEATRIARSSMTDETPTAPWTCAACGEVSEGQFRACWQCGEPRPSDES